MNIKQAKVTLDKIQRLLKSMELAPEQVTRIEKDLMRSYVQQLYEFLLEEAQPERSVPNPEPRPPQPDKPAHFTPPPEPKAEIQPDPPAPQPNPKSEAPPEEVPSPPPPPPPPPPASRPEGEEEEYEHLFEQEKARELADKLGDAPLHDLTRAFSINDRLYYINELFNRSQDEFIQTLQQLNTLNSFDAARQYLSQGVARKYDWTAKEKRAAAKAFIKTVRRKFN